MEVKAKNDMMIKVGSWVTWKDDIEEYAKVIKVEQNKITVEQWDSVEGKNNVFEMIPRFVYLNIP